MPGQVRSADDNLGQAILEMPRSRKGRTVTRNRIRRPEGRGWEGWLEDPDFQTKGALEGKAGLS